MCQGDNGRKKKSIVKMAHNKFLCIKYKVYNYSNNLGGSSDGGWIGVC